MITLRQHLISLIAVFLALGLGVIAGTTLISPATVRALNHTLDGLKAQENAAEATNAALGQEVGGLTAWAAAARDRMVAGTLTGRPAVVLSFDTTPAAETTAVVNTLVEAGARVEGSIVLKSELGLPDDTSRQQVGAALGLTGSATDVAAALVSRLADALSGRSAGALGKLVSAGLATAQTVPSGVAPAALASPGSEIVILAPVQAAPVPGQKTPPDLAKALIVPLAESLTTTTTLLAIAEDGSSSLPVLSEVRGNPAIRAVTVDGVDTATGQADVALGLQDAAAGVWGDYGTGPGATDPLPTPLSAVGASPSPGATTGSRAAPSPAG